jgi:tetracycline resistance efflux pump
MKVEEAVGAKRAPVQPNKRVFIGFGVIAAIILLVVAFMPEGQEDFGFLSVIPALFLVGYIFWTKRILEALLLATGLGFLFVHKLGFFWAFMDGLLEVGMSEDMVWLWIVCGLMGSIIALIEKAGGAFAFGEWVSRRAKTKKSTLIWTWILGIAIFIDDYLNSLTVGSCMAPITDKHKTSREFLSYVVDSTAAPICVLIPISTWAVFASGLFEANGWAPQGEGFAYFLKTIPFNFYAWFAAIVVPLVILGIIPMVGPMKKAEKRSMETGVLAPEGSERIDIKAGEEELVIPENPKIMNFFLPIIVLVFATVFFDQDMMAGVIITLAFQAIFYIPQGIMTLEEFSDLVVKGIKNMLYPLLLMVLAFIFAAANEQIGFTAYVISSAAPLMTPALLPLIVFLVLGVTEFITGTNWGMYIIALPIVIPLAIAVDANVTLAAAAVLSAGVFGSHICFYSDATILTSAACGCDNYRHAITQMPFGFIAAGFSAVAFLIAGFLF